MNQLDEQINEFAAPRNVGLHSAKNVDGNGAATPARRFGEVSKNLTDRTPARSFSSGSRSKLGLTPVPASHVRARRTAHAPPLSVFLENTPPSSIRDDSQLDTSLDAEQHKEDDIDELDGNLRTILEQLEGRISITENFHYKYPDVDDYPVEYAPPDSDEEMDYGSTYRACRHTQQEKQVLEKKKQIADWFGGEAKDVAMKGNVLDAMKLLGPREWMYPSESEVAAYREIDTDKVDLATRLPDCDAELQQELKRIQEEFQEWLDMPLSPPAYSSYNFDEDDYE